MSMEGEPDPEGVPPKKKPRLPQKKYYRQRAHVNPIAHHEFPDVPIRPGLMDWSKCYPIEGKQLEFKDRVKFLDVGCGYGGLLVNLGEMYPNTKSLGMEIRSKVSKYVQDKIVAMRELFKGSYNNVGCLRTNAMKFLPNYFLKGQLSKMFFLFPDPHFKRTKHKWRIISDTLLAEYAYVLRCNGLLYIATDVSDLNDWMLKHLNEHPLFEKVSEEDMAADPVLGLVKSSTEEGKKVDRNNGKKYIHVFRRIPSGKKSWTVIPDPGVDDGVHDFGNEDGDDGDEKEEEEEEENDPDENLANFDEEKKPISMEQKPELVDAEKDEKTKDDGKGQHVKEANDGCQAKKEGVEIQTEKKTEIVQEAKIEGGDEMEVDVGSAPNSNVGKNVDEGIAFGKEDPALGEKREESNFGIKLEIYDEKVKSITVPVIPHKAITRFVIIDYD